MTCRLANCQSGAGQGIGGGRLEKTQAVGGKEGWDTVGGEADGLWSTLRKDGEARGRQMKQGVGGNPSSWE